MADTVLTELKIHDFDTLEQMSQYESEIGNNDIVFTPDMSAKLFLFKHAWADYLVSDMSWLRADTFSWHSGETYEAAYEHLLKDYDSSDFQRAVWGQNESGYIDVYTTTGTPEIGTIVYDTDIGEEVGTVSAIGDNYIDVDNYGDTYRFYRARDLDVMSHSDTIGDITIKYALAQDGHKICLPDQESNIVALYEATGVAWYYILDTENKQFKLPRTKYGFTGLRDSVGGYVEPGAPNITGAFHADDAGFGNNAATGAFRTDTSTTANVRSTGNNSCYPRVYFDASLSSSVYGNSATVQPPATQMYLYFYVGNFEQDAVEQTAGINAEMFNDLNAHKVIEFQKPTAENGYTWYRKYADGWVEQGGVGIAADASSAFRATFPVVMADTNFTLLAISKTPSSTSASTPHGCHYSSKTTTGCNIISLAGNSGSWVTAEVCWQASGIAA